MTTSLPSAAPRLLHAQGLTKTFGSGDMASTVLRGIDLALCPGELTLLMGPSGSGKTTLLSIFGCLMTPTEGALWLGGESVSTLAPEALAGIRRRHVGFIFQSYNLFPTLTALDNVLLALDVKRSLSEDPVALASAALTAVGLSHRLHAYPKKLSGGEKQRVAIARALAASPSVILADEPTAALDKENGRAVMALLAQVAKDPTRAVLAVTHDPRMLECADRILHIDDGHIVADERPQKATPATSTGPQFAHAPA